MPFEPHPKEWYGVIFILSVIDFSCPNDHSFVKTVNAFAQVSRRTVILGG